MLEADRLVIYAASENEMQKIIEAERDEALRKAYGEMLRGSLEHSEDWGWYALWLVVRKDGAYIGNLSFKGSPTDGAVELGYGIAEEYRGFGYATEAVETIMEWAFDQPGVTRITAETAADNLASQRVLEKCGFRPSSMGKEGPRYVKEPEDKEDYMEDYI